MNQTPTNPLPLPTGYPELLAEIGHILRGQLPTVPDVDLLAALEAIRTELGGTTHYVPRGQAFDPTVRDAAIYAAFNGRNYTELANAHGLTEAQVRQIIQRQRVASHTPQATSGLLSDVLSILRAAAQMTPDPQSPQSPAGQTAVAQAPRHAGEPPETNSPAAPAAPQTPPCLVLLVPPQWAGFVSFYPTSTSNP